MKKITLIACPWIFHGEAEFRSQQLGLGYVGAYAERSKHRVIAFIDPMVGGGENIKRAVQTKYQTVYRFGYPDEWIVNQIPDDTDVIGVNAPFTDSRLPFYPLSRAIKAAFPSVPLVVGGVLASTLTSQVMAESSADIAVKGEGEIAFTRILNGEPPDRIPGVACRKDGAAIESPLRGERLSPAEDEPSPGYGFRPMAEYIRWSPRGNRADRTLSVVSSRGCPNACQFCSIPEKNRRWQPFSPDSVMREIKKAANLWGVNHIEFEDDNFTFDEKRALSILESIGDLRSAGLPLFCSFPNGIAIERMTRDLALAMKRAGTEVAYLPVESGDERILACMGKPHAGTHLSKTLEVAKWCVEARLRIGCFFIVAYPGGRIKTKDCLNPDYASFMEKDGDGIYMRGEDEKSFEKTLAFCRKLRGMGVQGITPLIATPYPGTELYEYCEKFGLLAYPDGKDVLTTVSYAAMKPEFVQIDAPWCSRAQAFVRWQIMAELFPIFHNIRKQ